MLLECTYYILYLLINSTYIMKSDPYIVQKLMRKSAFQKDRRFGGALKTSPFYIQNQF